MKTKAKAHEILTKNQIFFSRGEMRRAIAQNAVSINGVKVEDIEQEFEIGNDVIIKKGNKKFINNVEIFDGPIINKQGKTEIYSNGKKIGSQG